MSLSPANNEVRADTRKDRMIPWYFVMAFGVVFAVNGLFVYLATSTMPGVVNEHHFEAGVAFNDVIAQSEAQQQRGWQSDLQVQDGALQLTLLDKDGTPLEGAEIMATLTRPTSDFKPQQFNLISKGNGRYAVPFTYPAHGQWDISIDATWNKQPYHQTHRLIAK